MSDFRIFPIRLNQVVSFVLSLVLLGGLAACATGPTSEQLAHADYGPPPPESHQEIIKEWFEERLIDPTSPLYSFRNPTRGHTNDSPLYGDAVAVRMDCLRLCERQKPYGGLRWTRTILHTLQRGANGFHT